MKINIARYQNKDKDVWDRWVNTAKNGHFMFYRNYMDYHRDRFIDHSLLFLVDDQLAGILPANQNGNNLISHGGLTFGGFLTQESMRTPLMLSLFQSLQSYLSKNHLQKLRYKAMPYIYQTVPADEDLYALFRLNAKLIRRDASSTIRTDYRLTYSKGRKYSLKLANKNGLTMQVSTDFKSFMDLEAKVLASKYNTKPVHTPEEIALLASHFPDNIKLFTVYKDDRLLAGLIAYNSRWVCHAQYMAASDEGKEIGALDFIIDSILSNHCQTSRYFDFGISTENEGQFLNEGLIAQKEMFGARCVLYDTYELEF